VQLTVKGKSSVSEVGGKYAHANPPHFSIFSFTNIKKSGKYFGSSQFFVHGLAALSKAQLKS